MITKREPWIKFFFADWRAEPRLKMCSRAARSLWLDMMGLMHESNPYGFLLVEGIAPSTQQLANLVGDPERQVKAWLEELRLAGVFSVVGQTMPDDVAGMIPLNAPAGTILSRRMLRDLDKRERDRENGKKGGNRTLRGLTGGDNPPQSAGVNLDNSRGLRPRSQRPESRNTPLPPSEPVNPPVPQPCWDRHRDSALRMFGKYFCDWSLFACQIATETGEEVALEAPNRVILSRVSVEGQRLHELFGRTVKCRLAAKVPA